MATLKHPPVSLSELLSVYKTDISSSSSNNDDRFTIRGISSNGAALRRAVTLQELLLHYRKRIDGENVESQVNIVARSRAMHDQVLMLKSESSSGKEEIVTPKPDSTPLLPQLLSSSTMAVTTGNFAKCPDTFADFELHLSPDSSATSSQHREEDEEKDEVSIELDIIEDDEPQKEDEHQSATVSEATKEPSPMQQHSQVACVSDAISTIFVPAVISSQVSIHTCSIADDGDSIEFDEDNIPVFVKRPFRIDEEDANVQHEVRFNGAGIDRSESKNASYNFSMKKRKRAVVPRAISRHRTGRLYHVLTTSLLMVHNHDYNITASCARNRLKSKIPIADDTLSIVNGFYPPISHDEECRTLILRFNRQLHSDHFGAEASVPIEVGGFTAAQIRESFMPPKISTRSSSISPEDIDWISQISVPMSILTGFEYGIDSHENTISSQFAIVFTESAMTLKDWSMDAIIARITTHSKLENRLCWNIKG